MSKPLQILLVEDTPSDVTLTEEALKDCPLDSKLAVVYDGEQAIDYLRRKGGHADAPRPDVILLDLNMPKKDGHEVLNEMKDDSDLESIPVVVLTVSQHEEEIVRAMDLKMNYYLNKPVNSKTLYPILLSIKELWA